MKIYWIPVRKWQVTVTWQWNENLTSIDFLATLSPQITKDYKLNEKIPTKSRQKRLTQDQGICRNQIERTTSQLNRPTFIK